MKPAITALVTGSTRGIGRAIAEAILADGGRVMITGRADASVIATIAELESRHDAVGRVDGRVLDVRHGAQAQAVVRDTVARFGTLNTLINNAGIGVFHEVATMTDAQWSQVIETNLNGPFFCSRAAIPELKKAGGAWIISIASLAGRNYFPGGGAYCASKAALIAFSEVLMQEVRYDDIRVSVIMPGSVATDFSSRSTGDSSWKLSGDDVANVVMDLLRHPNRSLPSRVELRPSKPKGTS